MMPVIRIFRTISDLLIRRFGVMFLVETKKLMFIYISEYGNRQKTRGCTYE